MQRNADIGLFTKPSKFIKRKKPGRLKKLQTPRILFVSQINDSFCITDKLTMHAWE